MAIVIYVFKNKNTSDPYWVYIYNPIIPKIGSLVDAKKIFFSSFFKYVPTKPIYQYGLSYQLPFNWKSYSKQNLKSVVFI